MSADCSIFRKLDGTELAVVTIQTARIFEDHVRIAEQEGRS